MRKVWLHGLVYDLYRSISSRTFIASTFFILVISILFGVSLVGSVTSPQSNNLNADHAYYFEGGSYHLVSYFFDSTGVPVIGLTTKLTVMNSTSIVFYSIQNTSRRGFANYTFLPPRETVQYVAFENYTYLGGGGNNIFVLNNTIEGLRQFSGVGYHISTVNKPHNPYAFNLMIFYLGNNGSTSGTDNVYINQTTGLFGSSVQYPFKEALVATLSNFHIAVVNIHLKPTGSTQFYDVYVYSSNGSLLAESVNAVLYLPSPGDQVAHQVADSLESLMPMVGSIIAIAVSYSIYGRLLSTGVIESILVRPLTRGQFLVSKWISGSLSMFMLPLFLLTTINIMCQWLLGFSIPANDFIILLAGTFLSMEAFFGIMTAMSNIAKSDAVLLGTALFVTIVFGLLWTDIIPLLASAFSLSNLSESYLSFQLLLYYINPIGGVTLSATAVTGGFMNYITPLSISDFAPTLPNIIIDGALWSFLTFSASYLTIRRK